MTKCQFWEMEWIIPFCSCLRLIQYKNSKNLHVNMLKQQKNHGPKEHCHLKRCNPQKEALFIILPTPICSVIPFGERFKLHHLEPQQCITKDKAEGQNSIVSASSHQIILDKMATPRNPAGSMFICGHKTKNTPSFDTIKISKVCITLFRNSKWSPIQCSNWSLAIADL